jgi:hypothetical protein
MLSIECGFKRTASGAPVASGSPVSTIIGAEGSLIGAYAYADVSTNDIIVQLVGLAGVTAYWAACIESQIVQTST